MDKAEVKQASRYNKFIVEALAEYAHESWSSWMQYLWEKSFKLFGFIIIPQWAVRRWYRQMNTPYVLLHDKEKASDRNEAEKMLEIIERTNREFTERNKNKL